MDQVKERNKARSRRQVRVRKKIQGTDAKPRLTVYRSLRYTSAQLISDESGQTLCSVSSRTIDVDGKSRRSKEAATLVGKTVAELAKEKGIESVVFDRNGYIYHGRVSSVAEGAREGGLKI